jgi:hypothetical protein
MHGQAPVDLGGAEQRVALDLEARDVEALALPLRMGGGTTQNHQGHCRGHGASNPLSHHASAHLFFQQHAGLNK